MSTHRVLLVEDNPDDVELTLYTIKKYKLDLEVVVARDGEEALARLTEGPAPDFVLLDLNLPKVTGMEVLRRLRSDAGLRSMPVIVLTGSKQDEDFLESCCLGVDAYVSKPVDLIQFGRALRQLGLHRMIAANGAK